MHVALTFIAAALFAMSSAALHAAEAPGKRDVIPIQKLAPFLADYNQFLLSGEGPECKGKTRCDVDVDVWLVNSQGIDFCLTQFPKELHFDRPTLVVWRLKQHVLTSTTTGKSFNIEFQRDNGILPIRDKHWQIWGGGFGDGTVSNRWWYFRKNMYLAKDNAIVYVPLILQTLTTDENDVGVCAAGDPRMVNE